MKRIKLNEEYLKGLKRTYDSGSYILIIRLSKKININLRSKSFFLQKGWYIYIGKAKKNLISRILRHIRKNKKLYWHIDYLLKEAKIFEIYFFKDALSECKIAQRIIEISDNFINGFGSSDCRCKSHLAYFHNKPDISRLNQILLME